MLWYGPFLGTIHNRFPLPSWQSQPRPTDFDTHTQTHSLTHALTYSACLPVCPGVCLARSPFVGNLYPVQFATATRVSGQ